MVASRIERRAEIAASVVSLFAVVVFAALLLGAFAVDALRDTIGFSGYPADGPFQLYNALRRLEAGQRVGRDFQFFHGPALPHLHRWAFRLLGGTLQASETTRLLWSPVLVVATSLSVGFAATRRWMAGAVVGGAIVAGVALVPQNAVLSAGNSLLGERSSAPIAFAAVLLFPIRRRASRFLVRVAVLAGGLLVGTEQGVALLLGYVAAEVALGNGALARRVARVGATSIATAAAMFTLLLTLARSFRGATAAIRYNFVDVSRDQFWYFGAPPNPFHTSIRDIVDDATLTGSAAVALVLLVALVPLRSRGVLSRPDALASATLLVYGLLSLSSSLGIASATNSHPCLRAVVVVSVLVLWRLGERVGDRRASVVRVATAVAIVAVVLVASDRSDVARARALPTLAGRLADEGVGLGASWAAYSKRVDALIGDAGCAGPSDVRLWSTYAGLAEDERGCFAPREDYIIHALGPEGRAAYVEEFVEAAPEHVQTIRTDFFVYENWLRSTTWPFYEHLYRHYTPLGTTTHSILWRRSRVGEATLEMSSARKAHQVRRDELVLPVADGGADVVVLEGALRVDAPFASVPLLGGLPRYVFVVDTEASPREVAIDPASKRFRLAIFPSAPGDVRVHLSTRSLLPGASATVSNVRYRVGRFPDEPRWREATGTVSR